MIIIVSSRFFGLGRASSKTAGDETTSITVVGWFNEFTSYSFAHRGLSRPQPTEIFKRMAQGAQRGFSLVQA